MFEDFLKEFKIYFKDYFTFCTLPPDEDDDENSNDGDGVDGDGNSCDTTSDGTNCVSDVEIEKAFIESKFHSNINCLKGNDKRIALLYLVAHLLESNRKLKNNHDVDSRVIDSKTVGSVSVSYSPVSERIRNNPRYAFFFSTGFGERYFMMAQKCIVNNRFFYVRGA